MTSFYSTEIVANSTNLMEHFFPKQNAAVKVQELLKNTGGVIAGGAALWLAAPFCDIGNFKGDIDIWVADSAGLVRNHAGPGKRGYTQYRNDCYASRDHMLLEKYISMSLKELGYERCLNSQFTADSANYDCRVDKQFKYINTSQSFTSGSGENMKKIQVMFTNIPVSEIVGKFDISVCQTYWNGCAPFGLHSYYPQHIADRVFENLSPLSANRAVREAKYIARGFKLLE